MSRNGSGTYTLPAGNPVVTGTTISSTVQNNTMSDVASALTQSISNDGQTPILANIPFSSKKITGLGAPTTAGDALSFGEDATVGDLVASSLVVSGKAATTPASVTFNATQVINTSLSNVFRLTLTASISSLSLTNPTDGQTINLFLTQGGSGSYTVAWPASVKWVGGVSPTLSTAVSSVDLVIMTYLSATTTWYSSLAKGFA